MAGSWRWVARCCPVTRQANRSLTPNTRWRRRTAARRRSGPRSFPCLVEPSCPQQRGRQTLKSRGPTDRGQAKGSNRSSQQRRHALGQPRRTTFARRRLLRYPSETGQALVVWSWLPLLAQRWHGLKAEPLWKTSSNVSRYGTSTSASARGFLAHSQGTKLTAGTSSLRRQAEANARSPRDSMRSFPVIEFTSAFAAALPGALLPQRLVAPPHRLLSRDRDVVRRRFPQVESAPHRP